MVFDVVVLGGGAAGFFGAIQIASKNRNLSVLILERTTKLLTKVKVSGGGRCNVTNDCFNPFALSRHYPRGEKALKKLFQNYHCQHVVEWFTDKGVELKVERDGRMFPTTNDSQTIIDCFMREVRRLNIIVETGQGVKKIKSDNGIFELETESSTYRAKKVLVAIGGHAKPTAYSFLEDLGHKIVEPIPSLFTFNNKDDRFKDLMGISVQQAQIKIAATKFMSEGPVLITHWGLSGPAIIRLSAWAATYLHEKQYVFDVLVNWIGLKEDTCRQQLMECKASRSKQKIYSNAAFDVALRLWQRFCEMSDIDETKLWGEISTKQINRLVENLTHCVFHIQGKTTFKEEFVTCGGIDLPEVNLETMESRVVKNLFFAGEVLNVDGETGGFNFQAAWTTAYQASLGITQA